jgi:hypothetical protein
MGAMTLFHSAAHPFGTSSSGFLLAASPGVNYHRIVLIGTNMAALISAILTSKGFFCRLKGPVLLFSQFSVLFCIPQSPFQQSIGGGIS